MTTRMVLRSLAIGGLTFLVAASAAFALPSDRAEPEVNMPSDGRPIVATVVAVDERAGKVTVDTPHGRVDLMVARDIAEQLTTGDVIVLRITDEDEEFPSASPRETPPAPQPRNTI